MPRKPIYFDNAAATPMRVEVQKILFDYNKEFYANPSGLSLMSQQESKQIHECRKRVAQIVHAQSDTIFFTRGGTHSINLALKGIVYAQGVFNPDGKPHVITSVIEHSAVKNTLEHLEDAGFIELEKLPVNEFGQVSAKQVKDALRANTVLVSVMYANNEIGSVQPIADIGREILKHRKAHDTKFPYFHTDACQAPNSLDLSVEKLHVDLMSLNGSKIGGAKGVGMLYKRRETPFYKSELGGNQQNGVVPGTEDVAGILAFTAALSFAHMEKEKYMVSTSLLSRRFLEGLKQIFPNTRLNGPDIEGDERLVNNVHVTIPGVDAEQFAIYLDAQGVVVGLGSACTAESDESSHVLMAIGLGQEDAGSSIRVSFGKQNTEKEVDNALKAIKKVKALVYADKF